MKRNLLFVMMLLLFISYPVQCFPENLHKYATVVLLAGTTGTITGIGFGLCSLPLAIALAIGASGGRSKEESNVVFDRLVVGSAALGFFAGVLVVAGPVLAADFLEKYEFVPQRTDFDSML